MSEFVRFVFSAGGVSVVLFACALFLLLRPHSRVARRALLSLGVFYLLASVYAVPATVGRVLLFGLRPFGAADAAPGPTVIVVLGSGSITVRDWEGGEFSTTDALASARVLEAARVFGLLPSATVISSGGVVQTDDPSVATGETMRRALVALGIPADRLLVETESRNTRDEARIVKRMLQARPPARVVLVTSDLHMRRSLGTFKAVGIDAAPAIARNPLADLAPGRRWLPSDRGMWYSGLVAHELIGIGYYAARGWFVL